MKDHYKLTAVPILPSEQLSEHLLVTFTASNSVKARRRWTVYCGDLTELFDRIVSRTEAEKIVSALSKGLAIDFRCTFTPRQMRPLGFLELE
jgi:hypothetical protein